MRNHIFIVLSILSLVFGGVPGSELLLMAAMAGVSLWIKYWWMIAIPAVVITLILVLRTVRGHNIMVKLDGLERVLRNINAQTADTEEKTLAKHTKKLAEILNELGALSQKQASTQEGVAACTQNQGALSLQIARFRTEQSELRELQKQVLDSVLLVTMYLTTPNRTQSDVQHAENIIKKALALLIPDEDKRASRVFELQQRHRPQSQ